jgi:Fur family ferric uptake transcriptional regulator
MSGDHSHPHAGPPVTPQVAGPVAGAGLPEHGHGHNHGHAHAHAHGHYLDAALEALRQLGHRITAPRKALLRVLTQEHGPFTADELHKRLPADLCDPVTVYRGIATLEEANLVRRCDFGDGMYRYEFNTGEHHHHHVICRSCGSVVTLDVCFADGLERMVRQMGYANVTHTLEIFGICAVCQKKRRPEE